MGKPSSSVALMEAVSSDTVYTRRSLSLTTTFLDAALRSGPSCHAQLAGGGAPRVLHEHGHGHGPHATRYRRDGPGARRHRVEVDVARELARVEAVHPDVDDHGAFLDHVAGDEARPPCRHAENVGAPAMRREVPSACVAHGDGGVAREEELRER